MLVAGVLHAEEGKRKALRLLPLLKNVDDEES